MRFEHPFFDALPNAANNNPMRKLTIMRLVLSLDYWLYSEMRRGKSVETNRIKNNRIVSRVEDKLRTLRLPKRFEHLPLSMQCGTQDLF